MPPAARPVPASVVAVARRQDQLITRRQTAACGLPTSQLDGLLRHHRWTRVLPSVYLTTAAKPTSRQWIRAAVLWAGDDAVLLGMAALSWQRRTNVDARIVEVAVGRRQRDPTSVPDGFPRIVTRRVVVPEDWRIRWDGLWTARTEYAVAQTLSSDGPAAFDEAIRRQWVHLPDVVDAGAAITCRRGSRRRTEILSAASGGAVSEAERLLHLHLRRAGIVDWRGNAPVRLSNGRGDETRVADVLFDDARLVLEVDGFAWHTDHLRFQDDRSRQNLFAAAGFTVLRFTWEDLTDRPGVVIDTVRRTRARLVATDQEAVAVHHQSGPVVTAPPGTEAALLGARRPGGQVGSRGCEWRASG